MKASDLKKEVDMTNLYIFEDDRFQKYLSSKTMTVKELLDMVDGLNNMEKNLNEARNNALAKINEVLS